MQFNWDHSGSTEQKKHGARAGEGCPKSLSPKPGAIKLQKAVRLREGSLIAKRNYRPGAAIFGRKAGESRIVVVALIPDRTGRRATSGAGERHTQRTQDMQLACCLSPSLKPC